MRSLVKFGTSLKFFFFLSETPLEHPDYHRVISCCSEYNGKLCTIYLTFECSNPLAASQIPTRRARVIAPASSPARPRDPRLMRIRQSADQVQQQRHHNPLPIGPLVLSSGLSRPKSLPRTPKFHQSNNHASSSYERNHESRSRRKEERSPKSLRWNDRKNEIAPKRRAYTISSGSSVDGDDGSRARRRKMQYFNGKEPSTKPTTIDATRVQPGNPEPLVPIPLLENHVLENEMHHDCTIGGIPSRFKINQSISINIINSAEYEKLVKKEFEVQTYDIMPMVVCNMNFEGAFSAQVKVGNRNSKYASFYLREGREELVMITKKLADRLKVL